MLDNNCKKEGKREMENSNTLYFRVWGNSAKMQNHPKTYTTNPFFCNNPINLPIS